jgi:hypothetical protein
MADLFTGSAPDPVTLTSTSTQTQPQYLTDFQKALASTATDFLGEPTKDAAGNITGYKTKTGAELVGDRPDYLANLQGGINPATGKEYTAAELPSLADLQRGQGALNQALTAGTDASGVTATDISKFYDPYQTQVIDEMQRQSDVNLQRNLMPALRALGVGTSGGAAGNRRTYDISGQALADVASQLQSQQTAARSAGYKQALDAALKEQGVQASAAGALGQVGAAESAAAERGIKTLSDVGAADLAYEQALIDAPLTRSINIGKIMQGYTYPTETTASKQEIPSQMSQSPLQQIAGLGSLIASAFPAGGKGAGDRAIKAVTDYLAEQQAKGLNANVADINRIYEESINSYDPSFAAVSGQDINDWLTSVISGTTTTD